MVTAICEFVDAASNRISYATAGHPAPILGGPHRRSVFLPHDGLPLGIQDNAEYRAFDVIVPDAAVVTLFTDGILEFGHDVIVGEQRLLEACRLAVDADDPAAAIYESVFGPATASDDVALLSLSFISQTSQFTPKSHSPSRATFRERFARVEFAHNGTRETPAWKHASTPRRMRSSSATVAVFRATAHR